MNTIQCSATVQRNPLCVGNYLSENFNEQPFFLFFMWLICLTCTYEPELWIWSSLVRMFCFEMFGFISYNVLQHTECGRWEWEIIGKERTGFTSNLSELVSKGKGFPLKAVCSQIINVYIGTASSIMIKKGHKENYPTLSQSIQSPLFYCSCTPSHRAYKEQIASLLIYTGSVLF